MEVREATDDDAAAVAALLGEGKRAARRLLRDRAVRVAVDDGEVVGAVAFEATDDAVHVTRLAGGPGAVDRLVEAPLAFARAESRPVVATVPASERETGTALREAGFEDAGAGPSFAGEPTRRFVYDRPAAD